MKTVTIRIVEFKTIVDSSNTTMEEIETCLKIFRTLNRSKAVFKIGNNDNIIID
jgi:hypothetical protein